MGEEPGTDEVLAVLEDITELMRKLDELPSKRRRVLGIERDAKQFAEELGPLLVRFAPDLEELPVDQAAGEFARRYRKARQHAHERKRLESELAEFNEELGESQERCERAREELAALVSQAGASSVAQLVQFETLVQRANDLRRRLQEQEGRLIEEGEGVSIEELVEEATGRDRAGVALELEGLEAEIDEADRAWRGVVSEVVSLERGLEYYEDEAAADSAQSLEQRAAEVRELLGRYVRIRLARAALQREIARYREKSQGPVLSRASELFERLTLGSFRALRVGFEERSLSCGGELGHGGGAACRAHCRHRGGGCGTALDVCADGRHCA
jgi:uncharacterized protein YhaN